MLRQQYMEKLAGWRADQLIFVDESAANERASNRKLGRGITPHEYRLFKLSECWSILPAYTVDGFITWEVLQGSFTMELFEEFIEFKVLTLIQLNALLLSWITLLYISQRYVPMLKRLLITSASKIFALRMASSLNFSLLIHRTIIRLKKLLLNSKHGLKSTIY